MNETLVQPQMTQESVDHQFANMVSQFSPTESAFPLDFQSYMEGFAAVQLNVESLSAPLTDNGKEAILGMQLAFAGVGELALGQSVQAPAAAIQAAMDNEHRMLDDLRSLVGSDDDKEDKPRARKYFTLAA